MDVFIINKDVRKSIDKKDEPISVYFFKYSGSLERKIMQLPDNNRSHLVPN